MFHDISVKKYHNWVNKMTISISVIYKKSSSLMNCIFNLVQRLIAFRSTPLWSTVADSCSSTVHIQFWSSFHRCCNFDSLMDAQHVCDSWGCYTSTLAFRLDGSTAHFQRISYALMKFRSTLSEPVTQRHCNH